MSSVVAHDRCEQTALDDWGSQSVSVIVPLYNEQACVETLSSELLDNLGVWNRNWEVILIDDGSTDGTGRAIERLAQRDERFTAIRLRRNYGQTAALMAGIDHARGSILVTMDGDLQNDPADIPRMVDRLDDGHDVVSGWRRDRQDQTLTRVLPSKCANWLVRVISGVSLHDTGCALKVYRRDVLRDVRLYGEMHRFVPIYAHMQGGAVTEMVVNHRPRRHGRSKYGLGRTYKVILDLVLLKFLASYAVRPIHILGGFGLACLAFSLIPILFAFFYKFTSVEAWQKGFTETPLPVVAAVLILVGFLSIQQGLLAEILIRTYFESQDKRTYTVRKVSGGTCSPRQVS